MMFSSENRWRCSILRRFETNGHKLPLCEFEKADALTAWTRGQLAHGVLLEKGKFVLHNKAGLTWCWKAGIDSVLKRDLCEIAAANEWRSVALYTFYFLSTARREERHLGLDSLKNRQLWWKGLAKKKRKENRIGPQKRLKKLEDLWRRAGRE